MTVSYGTDFSYANAKLSGSLVRLGAIPIIVNEVCGSEGRVFYHSGGEEGVCHVSELDLEPVPLGYVNHLGGCTFTCRIPARHWRQGLRDGLIHIKGRTANRVSITSRNLVNTILNIYPSMESCFEAIQNEEAVERAFSRDFALGHTRTASKGLLYQGQTVGSVTYVNEGYTITFNEGFEYLQELYQEQANG